MRLALLLLACLTATASAEGRLIYANDDDWDWASHAETSERSPLAGMYGEMSWSALDWLTHGLPKVRGVVIGTMPHVAEYRIDQLAELRHEQWSEHPAVAGEIASVLASPTPPNVIVMMRDSMNDPMPELSRADAKALAAFLAQGGRVMILDDWAVYVPVLHGLLGLGWDGQGALDNGALDELARSSHAETQTIVRDGGHAEGRALLMKAACASSTCTVSHQALAR